MNLLYFYSPSQRTETFMVSQSQSISGNVGQVKADE